ncbi:SDR family oxidoreductase [Streptomyces mirabilis]|uniref:SDR family oxidoreductase n=1 Tax=Streptomyces mirabilis TaxID=68239 RepID=UPI003325D0E0
MELNRRVAVVTGGGTGIGRASALLLAHEGASVIVAGRRRAPLDEVVSLIEAAGGQAIAHAADLTEEPEVETLTRRAVGEFGRLDIAVNAAGAAGVSTLIESDEELFVKVLNSNVKTTWLAMKYQIPAIADAGGGAIVNVSSRAGLAGTAGGSLYSAAKHAVIGLTKSAALEAASRHVRINAVCPGPTRTEQFDTIVRQAMPGKTPDEAAEMFGAKLPVGRIAQPDEVAAAIVWLAGPAASFLTGTAIPVDGGSGAG